MLNISIENVEYELEGRQATRVKGRAPSKDRARWHVQRLTNTADRAEGLNTCECQDAFGSAALVTETFGGERSWWCPVCKGKGKLGLTVTIRKAVL